MTGWGILLLALFFLLGLGVKSGKTMTLLVCMTALVLTVVMAGYIR